MQVPFSSILGRLLGVVLLGMSPGILGCDTVSAPDRTQQPPSVSALQIVPDSIHQSDLPPDQVQDSTAQVPLEVSARATDPDGTVVRVVFVLEPSSNPRGAISGQLPAQSQSASLYRGQLGLSLPLVDEIYTIRVFAVDDDSLASNQVTGQLRFVATDSSSTSAALMLSK
jgi:hypothetical protein